MIQQQISEIITRVVDRYIAEGRASTPYEINCGLCQDISADIIHEIPSGLRGAEVFVDDFLEGDVMDDDGVALDRDRVMANWPSFNIPEGLTWDDMDSISEQFGFAGTTHVWVEIEGRHYDAEVPDGVDNPLELPYFKRAFEVYLADAPGLGR